VKILLVEDDQIVRECVESLVVRSHGVLQLLVATNLDQGIALAANHADIGLTLLGAERSGQHAAKLARRFHAAHECVPLVVLAATEQEEAVLQALDAGAMGFINKGTSTRSLLCALRSVVGGGVYVPASILRARGMYNLPRNAVQCAAVRVSFVSERGDRRAAIARLMLWGRSNGAIAANLRISERSVRKEVSALLKEASVTNRSEFILVLAGCEFCLPTDTCTTAGQREASKRA
jgi:DNA-binding NarL/FixJ family response regulator